MRKLCLLFVFLVGFCPLMAQTYQVLNAGPFQKYNILNHLDASVTLGTTGIGIDLAAPVTNWAQLRVGYAIMPRLHYRMNFEVQVGDVKESKYDANGNRVTTKFDRMAAMLEDLTGYKVQDEVQMIGRPTYHNLKFLVDVFPFKNNRHFHFTAGFFYGPSKIADAYNVTEAMPSLLAVGIYNRLYNNTMVSYESIKFVDEKIAAGELKPGTDEEYGPWDYIPVLSVAGFEINSKTEITALYKQLVNNGRMGINLGTKTSDGSPYMMEPGSDGMVKADVRVRSFKPYFGVGYGGRLSKNNDRLHIAVDAGAMFWGKPRIVTHDGTDLASDIVNNTIGGKVGDYVKLVKPFTVFPVIDVRLVYSLF